MKHARTILVCMTTMVGALAVLTAQANPTFEVASIKPRKDVASGRGIGDSPGGLFNATNMSLWDLIREAYGLDASRVIGGPSWIKEERFDVSAKAAIDVPEAASGIAPVYRLMLRSLLAERFKLAVHEEEQERAVYALGLARGDKALGPKLRPFTTACETLKAQPDQARSVVNGLLNCGRSGNRSPTTSTLAGRGIPIAQMVSTIEGAVQRPVVDRTGLTGSYDYELTFASSMAADADGPTIFTAVQEQLGLKLDSQRAAVKVLVVDAAERPTEN